MARKKLNAALQGGGAHGAFTWGVLDALLRSERLSIHGVTGTSAGAMNAAVLVTGYMSGGEIAACEALEAFWRDVSQAARFSPFQRTPLDVLMGNWSLDSSPIYLAFDMASRVISPAITNPLEINPLEPIVNKHVNFEAIRSCSDFKIFVAATNVRTGKVRIFSHAELSTQALLASACIPQMFAPIEIEGEAYWDGGFMGNPPLYPLFYETDTRDTLIVQINPIVRDEVPTSAREIVNRVNEITFNSSLLKELRAVRFVTRLIESGKLNPDEYMRVRLHRIASTDLGPLSASSKYNAEWDFLTYLRDVGRQAAHNFMDTHFDSIGVRDTLNLDEELD
ncbi:MAG: patatin-like phospholipase family protein [Pseudomonadota bacterium]